MKILRRLLVVGLLALLASGAVLAARAGDRAPDIRLPRLGGGLVELKSLLGSGPVVVWFPDLPSVTREGFAPLQGVVAGERATLVVIPVVGPDAAAALQTATSFPELLLLHDADGSVTLGYAGEFIPGVSPRHNLFVISTRGHISFARFWPGVPESTLQAEVKAAR